MGIRERFYTEYDNIIGDVFEGYFDFLSIAASAVPKGTGSICDLGIGTGNLSLRVRERIPKINITGIDQDERMIAAAEKKIPGLKSIKGDIQEKDLPKVDVIISSLMTHHLEEESLNKVFRTVSEKAKRFVNFDIAFFDGYDLDKSIEEVLKHSKKSFPNKEDLEEIEKSMRDYDKPVNLSQHQKIFENLGMEFKVLSRKAPFVVYTAYWPSKKD